MPDAVTQFYSGTSGLVLPVPRSQYPPAFQDKSRLEYYAHLFNSLEVNSTFYKLPKISTVIKWTESVPDNFQFTFKLSKTISHSKGLDFNAADVEIFMKNISHMDNKKGCLLIQFPPGLKIEKLMQFRKLLKCITTVNSHHHWKLAIEFRNPSWYHNEVYDLLDQYKISLVIHDIPASATPLTSCRATFRYLRFHGPEDRYRGSYSDKFLQQYASYIKEWINEGKTVYCYFNNTMGDAVKNLLTLNKLVE